MKKELQTLAHKKVQLKIKIEKGFILTKAEKELARQLGLRDLKGKRI